MIIVEHYTQRLEPRGIHLGASVVLPSATGEHHYVWCKGEPTPPPKYHSYVMFEGILTLFDETNPGHCSRPICREIETPAITPVAQRTAPPPSKYGDHTLPDGTRKITLPPVEWPPRPEARSIEGITTMKTKSYSAARVRSASFNDETNTIDIVWSTGSDVCASTTLAGTFIERPSHGRRQCSA